MKYMRKNSFVVCLVISAILLTSSFAMPVLAAENTGIETSSVTRSVPGYYKCTGYMYILSVMGGPKFLLAAFTVMLVPITFGSFKEKHLI